MERECIIWKVPDQPLHHKWSCKSSCCSSTGLLIVQLVLSLTITCYEDKAQEGGHSHRHCVQSCDHSQDAVKGSRHFLRVGQTVKWCSGADIQHCGDKDTWLSLCACIVNRWSMGLGQKLVLIKRSRPFLDGHKSWPWSQLLTLHLYMGVTPPPQGSPRSRSSHNTSTA